LFIIKRSPLRPGVSEFFVDDESASHADYLGSLVVTHQLGPATFWANTNFTWRLQRFAYFDIWFFGHILILVVLI
jgi:hypothetical protein